MGLVLSTLKFFIFTALVLLIGQIQIGRHTIAQHFHNEVIQGWDWGKKEVSHWKVFSSLGEPQGWVPKSEPVKIVATPAPVLRKPIESETKKKDLEDLTNSDRESLMRLLQ